MLTLNGLRFTPLGELRKPGSRIVQTCASGALSESASKKKDKDKRHRAYYIQNNEIKNFKANLGCHIIMLHEIFTKGQVPVASVLASSYERMEQQR